MPGEVPMPAEASKVTAALAERARAMIAILKNVMVISLERKPICDLLEL